MDQKQTFGAYIRVKRQALSLTQSQLARELFVSESTVSKWERGLSYPDVSLIPAVCRALHISEHEFFLACDDENAAEQARAAAVGRGVMLAWQRFFAVSYAVALVVCLLCDLVLFHALDWFWIVLASIALAFCCTNLPFLVRRDRMAVCLAAGTVCLLFLLLSCWGFAGGRWLAWAVAITAAALALPWGLWALWRFYGRHLALLGLAWFSVWVFLLLGVVYLAAGGAFRLSFAWSIATLSIAFLWGYWAILWLLPGGPWMKAGGALLLSALAIPLGNGLCAWLLPGLGQAVLADYWNWASILAYLRAGSLAWVNILVFALLLLAGAAVLAAGGVKALRARRDREGGPGRGG